MHIPWWLSTFWNWFWYFRRGKIKYWVWNSGDTYKASASNGSITVWNCYGSTRESAKEMALFQLKKSIDELKV